MSRLIPAALGLLTTTTACLATIPLLSPTDEWNPILYPGVTSDYPSDTQANSDDLDLVGDADHAAVYTRFDDNSTPLITDDGELGYRLRMAGNKPPATFGGQAWIGADVNSDGALDLFIGANRNTISIHFAGTGSNTSPNTTTIDSTPFWSTPVSGSNFSWTEIDSALDPSATNLDIDNGGRTDYMLTFTVPFSQVVGAVDSLFPTLDFDDTAPLAYVTATATQGNSLNSDLNGLEGTSSDLTWTDLKALSPEVFVDGEPVVPEPGASALVMAMAAGLFFFVQKRRN